MVQNNRPQNQGSFPPDPKGGNTIRYDEPDGVTMGQNETNALRDGTGHPLIESGDWQNWRAGLKPRGRT